MRIALLEDDLDQAELLKHWLRSIDGTVIHFELGKSLLHELKSEHFDLFLLDWQLPDISGLEVVKWIRKHLDWSVPVVFLTVRSSEDDIVTALEAGADDYISKPLVHGVTMARIRTVLRRTQATSVGKKIEAPPFTFEFERNRVERAGVLIPMTPREFDLAVYFFSNIGRVLSRHTILKEVWGIAQQLNTRTVDTHVCKLRSKLNIQPEIGWRLNSVYQYGYRLEHLAAPVETLHEPQHSADGLRGVQPLKRSYLASLPAKSQALDAALAACQASGWSQASTNALNTLVHRVAGSLGQYQLDSQQHLAENIDLATRDSVGNQARIISRQIEELAASLRTIGLDHEQT